MSPIRNCKSSDNFIHAVPETANQLTMLKKQPKADPEAAATAPAEDGDKEESKELLDKDEKGGEEKGDEDKEGEKKDEDAEKKEEGENIRII